MKKIICINPIYLLILLSLLMTSCAPLASDYRKEGFNLVQRAFESYLVTDDFSMVVNLKNVRVHIVSDRKYFKWDKASASDSPVVGYATTGNEIFVFGKRLGNRIVINQAILGHEFNHLLNFKNPLVANPDKLERLEICYLNNSKRSEC